MSQIFEADYESLNRAPSSPYIYMQQRSKPDQTRVSFSYYEVVHDLLCF